MIEQQIDYNSPRIVSLHAAAPVAIIGTMDSSFAPTSLLLLVVGVVGIAIFILWLWSLIHSINNRYLTDQNRLIAILLIVLLGIVGSLVYLFLPRESQPQR